MRTSVGRIGDDVAGADLLLQRTQAGDLFSATTGGRHLPPVRVEHNYLLPFVFP